MSTEATIKAIDVLLSGISLAATLGINYREVIAAQERAKLEGRDLSADERQAFLDEAQAAIDKL